MTVIVVIVAGGCGQAPATFTPILPTPSAAAPTDSGVSAETPTPTPTETLTTGLETMPPWIVGTWVQENFMGSLSGMKTVRVYRFAPNGLYEYSQHLCQSVDSCSGASEQGLAILSGDTLTLVPQTPSAEGQRSYEYAVVRDEAVGDWTLRFALPGQLVDVFYLRG